MSFAIALSDEQWELVIDLFDPPGRRGAPSRISRRKTVVAPLSRGAAPARRRARACRTAKVR